MNKKLTYLALGDSYTIGESVSPAENFPSQTVHMLRDSGLDFQDAVIVAKTGWTTDELQEAIQKEKLQPGYDIVTLLIGVNNQYRGRSVENYYREFELLLNQAIRLAAGETGHVIVLSIPDWGVTPFAEGRDRKKIAEEIDQFNLVNKQIADKMGVHYIDITPCTREATRDSGLLAPDKLHPSGKDYQRWARKISHLIFSIIR